MRPGEGDAAAAVSVSALYVYPVKSCGGTAVDRLELIATGPRHDRELLVVDATSGLFLTQRQLPRMARIHPIIQDGYLRVAAPGMPPLAHALRVTGARRPITIWKDCVESVDQGETVASWFSEYLSHAVRVVRQHPSCVRRVDPSYATSRQDQVGFADGYPLLLISDASLAELNRRLPMPLPMNRFRPNIVIAGCTVPHAEDALGCFRIGHVPLRAVKPCARCVITTVEQQTGTPGVEPLRTLATYRKIPRGVLFGMNVIHQATGWIAIGQRVESDTQDHHTATTAMHAAPSMHDACAEAER